MAFLWDFCHNLTFVNPNSELNAEIFEIAGLTRIPSTSSIGAWKLGVGLLAMLTAWVCTAQNQIQFSQPFHGVTLIHRTLTTPAPLSIHVVIVDLRAAGIRFKLTPPGGTMETIAETTIDFLRRENAQLAINCHFYLPFPPLVPDIQLVGLAVSDGQIVSPFEGQPILPGFWDQSYAIIPYAPAINIDRYNHVSMVHLDPHFSDHRHIQEPVSLWNAFSGSAQIIQHGVRCLPTYSGPPNGLVPLNGYSDENSWYFTRHARTAIGFTQSGDQLILMAVEETFGSIGMTVGEVADFLIREFGVYEALNLDGDGSTSLAMEDPETHIARMINHSSSGPEGRIVGSSLAVFAIPTTDSNPATLRILTRGEKDAVLIWSAGPPERIVEGSTTPFLGPWTPLSSPPRIVGHRYELPISIESTPRYYRVALKTSPTPAPSEGP